GQTTYSPSSRPLPSGPPTWLQTFEITPNWPSLYEIAIRCSPTFASHNCAALKSSAAPTSIHSPGSIMFLLRRTIRGHGISGAYAAAKQTRINHASACPGPLSTLGMPPTTLFENQNGGTAA